LPALVLSPSKTVAGANITVSFDSTDINAISLLYLAFYAGVDVLYSQVVEGIALVPQELENATTVFTAVVVNETGTWSNGTILSALAVLQVEEIILRTQSEIYDDDSYDSPVSTETAIETVTGTATRAATETATETATKTATKTATETATITDSTIETVPETATTTSRDSTSMLLSSTDFSALTSTESAPSTDTSSVYALSPTVDVLTVSSVIDEYSPMPTDADDDYAMFTTGNDFE
jgi:hypothetical protein